MDNLICRKCMCVKLSAIVRRHLLIICHFKYKIVISTFQIDNVI